MKVCTKCKTEKDEKEFGRNKNSRDGLRHYCKICRSESESIYRLHKKDYDRQYNQDNKEARVKQSSEWRKNNPEARKAIIDRYNEKHGIVPKFKRNIIPQTREEKVEKHREYNRKMKRTVMDAYGKFCQCCGEDNIIFLAIDHIAGGGSKHLKENGITAGSFYRWLIKNNFPEGFQVLCHNCNFAKHVLKECPHQIKIYRLPEENGLTGIRMETRHH